MDTRSFQRCKFQLWGISTHKPSSLNFWTCIHVHGTLRDLAGGYQILLETARMQSVRQSQSVSLSHHCDSISQQCSVSRLLSAVCLSAVSCVNSLSVCPSSHSAAAQLFPLTTNFQYSSKFMDCASCGEAISSSDSPVQSYITLFLYKRWHNSSHHAVPRHTARP